MQNFKRDLLKKDLSALCSRFWEYLKKFFFFLFICWIWVMPTAAIIYSIWFGLDFLGVPLNAIITINKIILSVSPIIPIVIIWRDRNSKTAEDIEGAVMDMCFTAWIILLVILWIN